jgi:hypothetical protein
MYPSFASSQIIDKDKDECLAKIILGQQAERFAQDSKHG